MQEPIILTSQDSYLLKTSKRMTESTGQLEFKRSHLLEKVNKRGKNKHNEISIVSYFEIYPLFKLIEGEIE